MPLADQKTAHDIVEELGGGAAQWRVAILTGFIHFFNGSLSMVFASLTDVIIQDLGLTPTQSGLSVSLFCMGTILGGFVGGILGDHWGRKEPVVLSSLFVVVICCLSVLTAGFWSLSFFRLLIGFSVGLGQPGQQTLVTECTPSEWRMAFSTISCAMFPMGEMWGALLLTADDPFLVNSHWRLLTMAAGLPGLVSAWLAARVLCQSPLYLANRGRYAEAMEVVTEMRRQNGLPDIPVQLSPETTGRRPAQVTLQGQMKSILGGRLLLTTAIGCFYAFTMHGGALGSMIAFAKTMVGGVRLGGAPAVSLVVSTASEFFGYFLIFVAMGWPRKLILFLAFGFEALGMMLFATGVPHEDESAVMQVITMLGFYITNLGTPVLITVVYVYLSEVYPTASRALGCSLAMCFGSVGDGVFPPIVEYSASTPAAFFWVVAALHAVAAMLAGLLPYETQGQALLDNDDDCTQAVQYGAAGGLLPPPEASAAQGQA